MDGNSRQCILVYLDCTESNKINIQFCHAQNMQPTNCDMNTIDYLSKRPHINSDVSGNIAGNGLRVNSGYIMQI